MRILLFGSIPKQGVHYMPEGTDLLWPVINELAGDGMVELVDQRGRITIDVKRTGTGP